ncbi:MULTISPECIES: HNH endonuclease family protein [unclassified Rathayibacter]|uniref:HNH endonuclease family protein n=1 Tax=unclassified Rathayibacter TaxID=2609250 RepID=UPI0015E2D83A|nr:MULTISPECIES: HNH endonuclease family protein [unclassified Rathayibacter]
MRHWSAAPVRRRPRRRAGAILALLGAAALAVAAVALSDTAGGGGPEAVSSPAGASAASSSPAAPASSSPPAVVEPSAPETEPSAPQTEPSAPETEPSAPQTEPSTPPLATLAALASVEGPAAVPYDRDLFGQAWSDVDRNGCDTRNDVLGRDLLAPVFKPGTRDCKVLTGTLIDPYDGASVAFVSGTDTSRLVQIDHVVALGWAWHHGAWSWTDDQRLAFANDPANLVAASEQTNRAKSDAGPGEWLPPAAELRCGYVEQFVAVLSDYGLGIDARDRVASEAVLAVCGE